MNIFRKTDLPVGPARGRLVVSESVIKRTRTVLQASRGPDGRHEGIALWAGRLIEDDSYILSVLSPPNSHGRGFVHIAESDVGTAAQAARASHLGIIAQVHSHPGVGTDHSDGDDHLVLMPFEGMFSVVVGLYGRGSIDPDSGAGLHQYQSGRWTKISPTTSVLVIVPAEIKTNV